MDNKLRRTSPILVSIVMLGATLVGVEARTFTNKNGKTIEAELVAVYDERISLRLPSGKISEISLSTLSDDDQKHVRKWDEGNEVKISAGDLHLKIESFHKREGESTETSYRCVLDNRSLKRFKNLKVDYTIHTRINLVGGANSKDQTRLSTFTEQLGTLEPNERLPFETNTVIATDSKGGDGKEDQTRRETVIGIVMDFKVGDRTILKKSFPKVFNKRLEEEKARQAIRDREEKKREEIRDKEEANRRKSQERLDVFDR